MRSASKDRGFRSSIKSVRLLRFNFCLLLSLKFLSKANNQSKFCLIFIRLTELLNEEAADDFRFSSWRQLRRGCASVQKRVDFLSYATAVVGSLGSIKAPRPLGYRIYLVEVQPNKKECLLAKRFCWRSSFWATAGTLLLSLRSRQFLIVLLLLVGLARPLLCISMWIRSSATNTKLPSAQTFSQRRWWWMTNLWPCKFGILVSALSGWSFDVYFSNCASH